MVATATNPDDPSPKIYRDTYGRTFLAGADPVIPAVTDRPDGLGLQYVATDQRPRCQHVTPTMTQAVDADGDGRDDTVMVIRQTLEDLNGDGIANPGERVLLDWEGCRPIKPRSVMPADMGRAFRMACNRWVGRA